MKLTFGSSLVLPNTEAAFSGERARPIILMLRLYLKSASTRASRIYIPILPVSPVTSTVVSMYMRQFTAFAKMMSRSLFSISPPRLLIDSKHRLVLFKLEQSLEHIEIFRRSYLDVVIVLADYMHAVSKRSISHCRIEKRQSVLCFICRRSICLLDEFQPEGLRRRQIIGVIALAEVFDRRFLAVCNNY